MDVIKDEALAEVRALVRRGQSVPAIFVRSLLARLDQAEDRRETDRGRDRR